MYSEDFGTHPAENKIYRREKTAMKYCGWNKMDKWMDKF